MNSNSKSHFSWNQIDENRFTINSHSPKNVILKENYINFYDSDGIVNT